MAPPASLETFLVHCGTLIGERLEAAPFQTFLVLASVWIFSIPAFIFLITRYSSLFNSKNAKPQLRCRSCGSTDVTETLAGPSIPTPKKGN
ncbi:hypothetical protein N7516_006795 [Penicillium verrucosum]|uniref:uncharacterized protein n=1 Tax=Penicillium verrucosum TaxID=60171 RepID=UPI002545B152|nr:uncharacterized protein N7516_006795 [Penicillium verrucosum]KAJ5932306.1 hypothetical protein N7516_006795 [Penicillium verrucosum]